MVQRAGRVETSRHLQIFVRDWRRIFSLRWADLRHEVWVLDLWWVSGLGSKFVLGFSSLFPFSIPKTETESMKTQVLTLPLLLNLCRNVLRMKCMIFLAKAPILNSLRGFYLDAELMHGIFLAGFFTFFISVFVQQKSWHFHEKCKQRKGVR